MHPGVPRAAAHGADRVLRAAGMGADHHHRVSAMALILQASFYNTQKGNIPTSASPALDKCAQEIFYFGMIHRMWYLK